MKFKDLSVRPVDDLFDDESTTEMLQVLFQWTLCCGCYDLTHRSGSTAWTRLICKDISTRVSFSAVHSTVV